MKNRVLPWYTDAIFITFSLILNYFSVRFVLCSKQDYVAVHNEDNNNKCI